MNRDDELRRILDEETEASELTRDEPMQGGQRRAGKSLVYSIRLHPDEAEAIQQIADEAGVPARGLVRGWVLQALRAKLAKPDSVTSVVEALSRDVARLQHLVRLQDHPRKAG
jgi:hypothetical protein